MIEGKNIKHFDVKPNRILIETLDGLLIDIHSVTISPLVVDVLQYTGEDACKIVRGKEIENMEIRYSEPYQNQELSIMLVGSGELLIQSQPKNELGVDPATPTKLNIEFHPKS